MRYTEYIYLLAACMIGIFMLVEKAILSSTTLLKLGIAALALTGMYFLRRKQRMKKDRMLDAAIEDLENEEKEGYP